MLYIDVCMTSKTLHVLFTALCSYKCAYKLDGRMFGQWLANDKSSIISMQGLRDIVKEVWGEYYRRAV